MSHRPEDRDFGKRVAEVAGLGLFLAENPSELANHIANDKADVIFADASSEKEYATLESAIQDKVGLFSDKINPNAIHILTSSPVEEAKYLIQSPLFGHYVLRNYKDSPAADVYGRIVKATLSERAFGLSSLLKPGTKIQVVKLLSSSQKRDAIEAVRAYLVAAKFQNRMATAIANAVDEIIMNAIFDAPVDELGKAVYSATPRSTVINLEGRNSVEMHVGFDGQYVGISAIDFFGSLDKLKLLSHISKIYDKEEYKLRTSVAGAGIGLATVFRSGGSFFFVSESRVQTEVVVYFQRTDNYRDFKNQFRFISTQFYF